MKRKLLLLVVVALAAWCAWGLRVRARRPARPPPPAGELRGAWHVHTTASDGRGTLDEVLAAAREAGLQFVVVSDHNVLGPAAPAWREGVLVVPATEASTRYGHVVAAGVPRPLSEAERQGDPLGAISALGGQAVLAHPLHPERPFSGFGTGPWRGFEVVSNDTAWYRALAERSAGRILRAALVLPWDPPAAVLTLAEDPSRELARFDAEVAAARAVVPAAADVTARASARRALLCSADAHGYPSYGAAFGAFSMHVPVAPTGDAAADARAVLAALLGGRAACVLDGVALASGVRLRVRASAGTPEAVVLDVDAPATGDAEAVLLRDGAPVARAQVAPGAVSVPLPCGTRCAPGDYRVEVRRGGRPWIFTNPVAIE